MSVISYDLSGKCALVTGGASGIGLATAKMLAGYGAAVAVNHLAGDERGARAVAEITAAGGTAIAAPGDVGVPGEAERMTAAAIRALGGLDLLVNNAATPATSRVIPPAEFDAVTEEMWSTIVTTNLVSVFRCTKAAAAALTERQGAVVSTASIAGMGWPGSSLAYSSIKAALINLTKDLARALAPAVRVNAVAPGSVNSPWMVQRSEDDVRHSIDRSLLKRRGEPEDYAGVIVFLGFGTRLMTGQTVAVEAGTMLA